MKRFLLLSDFVCCMEKFPCGGQIFMQGTFYINHVKACSSDKCKSVRQLTQKIILQLMENGESLLSQHTCEACGQSLPQRKTP